jgi:2-amino-4-hydroxy-6-hydroxymethyldihydropteridine diphosphokinase
MPTAYLLLGSNLGDRHQRLRDAVTGITLLGTIAQVSSIYRSAAWGNTDQPDFLNATVELETALGPRQLLEAILGIEESMGRIRKEKWGSRVIDIDILFYDGIVIREEGLIIPHPEIQNRRFTLAPLAEIAPALKHPLTGETIETLLAKCNDNLIVEKEYKLA